MDTHWSSYLQIGLVHFMMYPETMGGDGPIVESIQRVAADPFFDVLESDADAGPGRAANGSGTSLTWAHMDLGFGSQPGILGNELNTAAIDRGPAPTLRGRHQSVYRSGLRARRPTAGDD